MQQLSVGEGNISLGKEETASRYAKLTKSEKNRILGELKARLESPVSLCKYSPAEAQIAGIENDAIDGRDVLEALDSVLKARMGRVASMPPSRR
jgi:hypothetical protein